ncbi:MAG TPA: hypothetical protein VHS31_00745 [Tepidisphaeraceae bacterium]|jgi:hypothetical protein|nr:hypothetical protein [Tepidisphaeraceae bacterium]
MLKASTIGRLLGVNVMCAALLVGSTGCPSEDHEPPMTPNDTTSETGMPEPVALDQLNELIGDASEYLVREMPNIPEVKSAGNQMVFAVPPDLEHDPAYPDGRLRAALASLKSKLQESEIFRNDFVVITGTQAENNRILNQVAGSNTSAFRDPLQRTPDKTKAETYDPTTVYVMTGKFYQMTDPNPGLRDYRLHITVVSPQTRQEVIHYEFHRTLKWNHKTGQWKETT